ncbi:multidrug ABC superfamily ATP binding cassette transporter, ABC protein [Candidatus Endolissoclinum faulkneri L5]|uniref:Multidrug ABC superfamily ATP binding cassette transporter, ABC protein n=1 Tax=Candidatus Endolissoclinum faulkneri L5 TaxID=1401328 RepID=V9TW68_9PROT|nr:ABC transporter ATP-binding protein/permease [Candidatus Endolissoclinum faulkneri]AHC73953.1 multidrug ABC superfamily ATP binding cassette transporter, ABC protein [Candidatus Endolissoclinum faulkneri L5]
MISYKPNTQRNDHSNWNTILTLIPYLWPKKQITIRARVIAALVCLFLAKVTTVYVPILYKLTIDIISNGSYFTLNSLISVIFGYGLLRVAQQAFGELREFFFARVSQLAIRTVALKTFKHLHSLSLRFHMDRQTGGLSRVIERGVNGIEFLLSFMLFNILPTLIEIIMVCGVLWYFFNFWYALVTFLTIGSYIAFTMLVTEWRLKFRRRMNEHDQTANTRAIDSLLNFETVKYLGNERHEERRYDTSLQRYADAAVASRGSLSLLNVGQGVIIAGSLIALMSMAGFGLKAGNMSVGDFVMVNTYLIQLFLPLNFLGFVYREMKQALTDMEAMFCLLKVNREVEDKPKAISLKKGPGRVEFENVYFSYCKEREILRGISFVVEPGQTVAIVGQSGVGKSTISRLLFRFYDVTSGAVRIDGQDIRDVTQQSLRCTLGIVPQDTVLFNDTIYYNIAYGRPGANQAEVEAVARHASIHDFISELPEGYQTIVGERGLKLSGGEKQRVAIARTLLKKPRIYVFDESTSALDSHTELAIQQSLRNISLGHTTLVIAHRLSTLVDSDRILVLKDGNIIEYGRHEELLAHKGIYAAMWSSQLHDNNQVPQKT